MVVKKLSLRIIVVIFVNSKVFSNLCKFEALRVAGAANKQYVWAARLRIAEVSNHVALARRFGLQVAHIFLRVLLTQYLAQLTG